MASGASGRGNSGSKGYDFASDDILGAYNDYANQDSPNGSLSEPTIGSSGSGKDMHKNRVTRSSVLPSMAYSQPENSFAQDMTDIVEKTMKKYADNLMRYLEGISSRLTQLESHCLSIDKSIVEMRSESSRGHKEMDSKLKFVEKHIQEVHRSVQIIRDKQELAETHKELAKLQFVRKGSNSSSHSLSNEERASSPASDLKRSDNISEMPSQQLALALPHQLTVHQQPVAPPSQAPSQQQSYYVQTNQVPNQQGPPPAPPSIPTQHPQSQYLSSDPQYRTPQIQELSRMAPQPPVSQVNQAPPNQSFPQYQQQWAQQLPQQVPSQQQSQLRPPSSTIYPSYSPPQSTNGSQPEALAHNVPTQVPYSGSPQPVSSRVDTIPYGYVAAGRTSPQQPPPQQIKGTYGAQPGDSYPASGPHPALPPGSAYMVYDSEGGRAHHHPSQQPHFAQAGYPPHNVPPQNQLPQGGTSLMVRNPNHPQVIRNHPYSELIEKLMSMGFRGDLAASVIQRMEESGQQVDFNTVLDRLNAHSAGAPQRGGW